MKNQIKLVSLSDWASFNKVDLEVFVIEELVSQVYTWLSDGNEWGPGANGYSEGGSVYSACFDRDQGIRFFMEFLGKDSKPNFLSDDEFINKVKDILINTLKFFPDDSIEFVIDSFDCEVI